MTKMEELKLLEKIEELLRSADSDSYISMTFAGISEVCRNNIVNDFGDEPVRDLDDLREKYYAEVRAHDTTKHLLADAQNIGSKAIEERDELRIKLKDAEDYRRSTEKYEQEMDDEITKWKNMYSDMCGIADRNGESAKEWEDNAHDAREMYCAKNAECEQKDAEIMRLKAEIYDLRKECEQNG